MLGKNAKVELLKRVPLFAGCSKKELEEVARIADEIDFAPGQTLIREGVRGRQFYVVVSGDVDVSQAGAPLPVRGGAEVFGEIALLTDAPTSATVTAATPVVALVLADHAFRALMEHAPDIRTKVMQSLADRTTPDQTS